MVIIPKSPIFLNEGAIVPNGKELEAMIHALIIERRRVTGEGTQYYSTKNVRYGELTIEELDAMIAQLQQHQKERGL